jgi:hypothetical protein
MNVDLFLQKESQLHSTVFAHDCTHASGASKYPSAFAMLLAMSSPRSPALAKEPSGLRMRTTTPGISLPALPKGQTLTPIGGQQMLVAVSVRPVDVELVLIWKRQGFSAP